MAKNNISDLRNMLFETMERLMDTEEPMDIHRVQTIADTGKVIIESAKVEVLAAKAFGWDDSQSSGFIQQPKTLEIGK